MTLPNAQHSFCSSRSRSVDEMLYGTAGQYGVYLLIEWNKTFPDGAAKVFAAQVFRGENTERWQDMLDSLPNPRVQVIRQRGYSTDTDGLSVFIAVPHESNPLLYEFRLQSYDEILDLDILGMMTGDLAYRSYLREDPLYLVCTNGAHDPCCARHGIPTYKALSLVVGKPWVWQTSHIGGHRFAGTAIAFPHAIYYGNLMQESVQSVVEDYDANRLNLTHYRGRACYSRVVQAAEYHLRETTGLVDLPGFRLIDQQQPEHNLWVITFEHLTDHSQHTLHLRTTLSDWANPMSCSNEDAEPVTLYTLEAYDVNAPQS